MDKIEAFKTYISGKDIGVLGIGISNLPLIRFLCKHGAKVTARDKKSRADLGDDRVAELCALGVELVLGEAYLENLNHTILFKTPGMRYDLPQLVKAREAGCVVTSEMEVFFALCPCKTIGITGSDGKTTTTTLIAKLLGHAGYTCHLGGNIGRPLLADIETIQPEDIAVLELSSFQLHTMRQSPDIAVLTNLSPNHLDMHKSMEEYCEAKENIFKFQSDTGLFVTNGDNALTCRYQGKGKTVYFSRQGKGEVTLQGGTIYYENTPVLPIDRIKIPGMHNVENYMAAIAAVWGMVSAQDIRHVAETFGGVEHRIELVRTLDGVRYYNSSIDSSPNRTKNTLAVFPEKVILISGGKDKGIPYDELGPVLARHVKKLFLIGATAEKIAEAAVAAGAELDIEFCTSYPEVVEKARSAAKPGDVVVLSPASTSFDMFANFEERGNLFKELVNQL